MKAGLLLTAGSAAGYVTGDFLMQSIRKAMPGVPVVQFTDAESPALVGVDEVQRLPGGPLALFIAEHWAKVDGDWLFVDTDVVVQKDVRPVFAELKFDVAVATREGTYMDGEEQSTFMRRMPFNCGVVYSRSAEARREIHRRVLAMSIEEQRWYGIQLAIAVMRPLVLYNTFNYPPKSVTDERISTAHVVHYKGAWRKQVLLQRIYQEVVCA